MRADYDYENNMDGEPTPNIFANIKSIFMFIAIVMLAIGVVIIIYSISNPEKIGEFMAKIVNGFTSNLQ